MQEKFVLLKSKYELEVLFGAVYQFGAPFYINALSHFSDSQYSTAFTMYHGICLLPPEHWQLTHFVPLSPFISMVSSILQHLLQHTENH